MAVKEFLLPDLGEGLTEAEVVRWLVAVGDTVSQDQPVAEVETSKAAVEVPSPFAGTVVALHVEEGDEVQVGRPLLSIDLGQGEADDGASGSVLVGYGTGGGGRDSRHRRGRQAAPKPAAPAPANPRAKPPVRKLAKDLGVNLADVDGSGPEGVVTREDVRTAAGEPRPVTAADEPGPAAADEREAERVPLRGVRKAMAAKMTTSRREIPEATAWVGCDATRLWRLRGRLAEAHPDVRVSALAIILRACVAGLREFPSLNSSLDADRGEALLHRRVHLGVATATDRGLLVPVIKDAHRLSTLRIAAELHRLATAARDGSVTPTELSGGTFTVSNYGSFGVDGGSPVINFPEAAILGVGRIADRPWIHKGAVRPRKVVQLSLAFDHRLADGAEAAGFLRLLADCIERPSTLIATL